jgi:hypothetical protein
MNDTVSITRKQKKMKKLSVLVGCEYSQTVTKYFRARGHDAFSCDLLPTDGNPAWHFQEDIFDVIKRDKWDLGIFFPPCTFLCSSGMHWTTRGLRDPQLTEDALDFVKMLLDAPIPKIALENPIGCISTRIRKPSQIIQPWQFGHPESKSTCLWLKNLPLLVPTNILPKPASGKWDNQTSSGQNKLGPSADRWKIRSTTYSGIGRAMSEQWSDDCSKDIQLELPLTF